MVSIAQAKRAAKMPRKQALAYLAKLDWTVDPKSGRSNSSPLYEMLVSEMACIIRDDARSLLNGNAESTARLILSRLAHCHKLRPAAR